MLWQHHGAMAKEAREGGFMSRQINAGEPSFLLVISTLSDQGLIQMSLWAFGKTQESSLWILMLQDLLLKTEISGGYCMGSLEYQINTIEPVCLLGTHTL